MMIYYGILAHSHEWKKENSSPKDNINKAIDEYDKIYIKYPIEMPDIVCVADIGVWNAQKVIAMNYSSEYITGDYVMSTYVAAEACENFYTPIGAFIFNLLDHIGWSYPSIRDLVSYMRKLNLNGAGSGYMRPWNLNVLSDETIKNLHLVENGGYWNEWGMVF